MKRRLLLSSFFLLQTLLAYVVVAQRFPVSGDDYSYLYQAKLFASGKLYAQDTLYDSAHPLHGCLATNCITDHRGRRFSKYPPGWPLLLALGVALGQAWLVGPLLGALLVFLMLTYVEQRLGRELVTTTWLLLTLCVFFCYYAASYRAHTATALFVFAAFLVYDATERQERHSWLRLFAVGVLLGYSSLIRYIDWVPLGCWIGVSLMRRKRFADLMLFGLGFGLLASGNLMYDSLLSGDPFETPTHLYGSSGLQDSLMITWRGFMVTAVRLGRLLLVFPPVLLLAVLWRRYREFSTLRVHLALFSMNVGVYFLYPAAIGGPGPRYFLAYFPFLVLAVVDLCRWIDRHGTSGDRRWRALTIGVQVACSLVLAATEGYTIHGRRDLERTTRQLADGKKIFLLKSGTYKTDRGDLTRNPAVLSSAASLYFALCAPPAVDELLSRFPGREVLVYEYPGRLTPYDGGLVPVPEAQR